MLSGESPWPCPAFSPSPPCLLQASYSEPVLPMAAMAVPRSATGPVGITPIMAGVMLPAGMTTSIIPATESTCLIEAVRATAGTTISDVIGKATAIRCGVARTVAISVTFAGDGKIVGRSGRSDETTAALLEAVPLHVSTLGLTGKPIAKRLEQKGAQTAVPSGRI